MRILIIGGGFMGSALGTYFATHNVEVLLYEANEQKRMELLAENDQVNLTIVDQLADFKKVSFIIEAISEDLIAKQNLFASLEEIFSSEVTFCTNTSSYLISDVSKLMKQKNRLIGTHFFSPADISPLVEVVPSDNTDTARIEQVMDFLTTVKKKPVLLKKEMAGFVANRLQSALAREAMSIVEQGIVSAEELDYIAKWSLGIRLANTGPLEQRDINGLDTHLAIAKYVYPTLENRITPMPILEGKCAAGSLGLKTKSGFYEWKSVDIQKHKARKDKVLKQIIEIVSEK